MKSLALGVCTTIHGAYNGWNMLAPQQTMEQNFVLDNMSLLGIALSSLHVSAYLKIFQTACLLYCLLGPWHRSATGTEQVAGENSLIYLCLA